MAHSLTEKVIEIIDEKIDKLTLPKFITDGYGAEDFEKLIANGDLKDKYFLGIGDFCQGFYTRDMFEFPGIVCIGRQGSGKSTTLIGVLNTLLASNSDRMAIFCLDTLKGMGDYAHLFKYKQSVFPIVELGGHKKLIPVFDIIGRELGQRAVILAGLNSIFEGVLNETAKVSKSFQDITDNYRYFVELYLSKWYKEMESGQLSEEARKVLEIAESGNLLRLSYEGNKNLRRLLDGEKLTSEDLEKCKVRSDFQGFRRILLVFEEFHDIVNHPILNFLENKSTPGTIAQKFFRVARVGRAMGIHIAIATQRASYNEFPKDLGAGITNPMAHAVSDESDANGVDLGPQAAALPDQFKGRIAVKEGLVQFPHFPTIKAEDLEEKWRVKNPNKDKSQMPKFETSSSMVKLLDKYYKEPTFEFVSTTVEEIQNAIGGKGTEGLVMNGKIGEIVSNRNMFEVSEMAKRLAKDFGFTYYEQDNQSLEVHGVMEKDGERYALLGLKKADTGGRGGYGRGVTYSKDKAESFSKQMKYKMINCKKVFILSFEDEQGTPKEASDLYKKHGGYLVNGSELEKIGKIYGNIEQNVADGVFDDLKMDISLNHPPLEVSNGEEDDSEMVDARGVPRGSQKIRKFDGWDDLD